MPKPPAPLLTATLFGVRLLTMTAGILQGCEHVETDDNPSYLNGIAFHTIRRIIIRLYSTLPTNIPIAD